MVMKIGKLSPTLSRLLLQHFRLATMSFFVGFGLSACADGDQADEPVQAESQADGQATGEDAVANGENTAPADEAEAAAAIAAAEGEEAPQEGDSGPIAEDATLTDSSEPAPALPEESPPPGDAFSGDSAPVVAAEPVAPTPVAAVAAAPVASSSGEGGTYIVQSGDTLAGISQKIYGTSAYWKNLAQSNNIAAPYLIFAGDDVRFALLNARAKQFSDKLSAVPTKTVTVKNGDTLSGIAHKLYGTWSAWKVLYSANKDKISNPHQISKGLVLSYMDPDALASVVGKSTHHAHVSKKSTKKATTVKAEPQKPAAPPVEVKKEEPAPKVAEAPKPEAKPAANKPQEEAAPTADEEVTEESPAAESESAAAPIESEEEAAPVEEAKEEPKSEAKAAPKSEEPVVANEADPDPEVDEEAPVEE